MNITSLEALLGFPVRMSPYAEEVKVTYSVVRFSTRRKKRKNWTVQRNEQRIPCCYMIGGQGFVMHPEFYAKLKNLPELHPL